MDIRYASRASRALAHRVAAPRPEPGLAPGPTPAPPSRAEHPARAGQDTGCPDLRNVAQGVEAAIVADALERV